MSDTMAQSGMPSVGNMAEVRFLNVYNGEGVTSEFENGEAIVVKSYDNKYLLFDTGNPDEGIVNNIYDTLKEMQGVDEVTLDYLVISHLDSDHDGNANAVIRHEHIAVKNVIVKYEKEFKSSHFRSIVANAAVAGVEKIYTSSNVDDGSVYQLFQDSSYSDAHKEEWYNYFVNHKEILTEGQALQLGNFVKMYFIMWRMFILAKNV